MVLLKVADYAEIKYKSLNYVPRFPNYAHEFPLLGSGKNFQKHFANKCQICIPLMFNDVPFSLNSQLPWNEDQRILGHVQKPLSRWFAVTVLRVVAQEMNMVSE